MIQVRSKLLKKAAPAPAPQAEVYELGDVSELFALMSRFVALRKGDTVVEGLITTADDQQLSFLGGPDFWGDDRYISFSEGFNKRVRTDRYPVSKINAKVLTNWVVNKMKGEFPMEGALKMSQEPQIPEMTAQQIASGDLDRALSHIRNTMYRFWALKSWAMKWYMQVGDEGSSRIVFELDPDHALKVAMNPAGIAQNIAESHFAQKLHGLPITKIHHVCEHGQALVVDLAHELSPATFKREYGMSFDLWAHAVHLVAIASTPDEEKQARSQFTKKGEHLMDTMEANGLASTDCARWENWGEVKSHAVMVDYGLTHEVWDEHYKKKGSLVTASALPLSQVVARVALARPALEALRKLIGGDFQGDGRWVFAHALHAMVPGSRIDRLATEDNPVAHLVVNVGGRLFDSDGASSLEAMQDKLRRATGEDVVSLKPFTPEDAMGHIPFDLRVVQVLKRLFQAYMAA